MIENFSKEFFEEQIKSLKEQQQGMKERIAHLEKMLQQKEKPILPVAAPPEAKTEEPPQSVNVSTVPNPQERPVGESVEKNAPVKEQQKPMDMELNFGRYWLNKIGVIVFTLGIGFLISYTFKYFTPLLKISFGYLISSLLFLVGYKFEKKEKLMHFGRVLLGGAWAMTYFTTYAMYHFEASRILQSQVVDIVLLAVVACGMVLHTMKYQSETMTSMAIFVAYLTSTLGAITGFTFISCLFLSVVVLILSYRYQWMKILFMGVGLTYFVHFFWIAPNIDNTFLPLGNGSGISPAIHKAVLNLVFLSVYWFVFVLGLHLIRVREDAQTRKIAVANFLNFLFFYALGYPLIMDLFFPQRFGIVFSVGLFYLVAALVMKNVYKHKTYLSDLVIGIMVITLSLPLRFMPNTTLLIWLTEIPFLLLTSFLFKEKIFRYISYFLSFLFFLRLTVLCLFPNASCCDVYLIGFHLRWYEFLYLVAAISLGFCGVYGEVVRRRSGLLVVDTFFNHVFSCFSFFYLTSFVCLVLPGNYLTFGLVVELFTLYGVSYLYGLRRLRIYGYILLPAILVRNFFVDDLGALRGVKWLVLGAEISAFYIVYWINRLLLRQKAQGSSDVGIIPLINVPFKSEGYLIVMVDMLLVLGLIYKYIQWQWISLALGLAGVCIVSGGILDKDKFLRVSGLLFFGLTLMRVLFIDLSDLDMIFKIITFIAIGGIFLVISFIYNNYIGEPKEGKDQTERE